MGNLDEVELGRAACGRAARLLAQAARRPDALVDRVRPSDLGQLTWTE
jgi:hypothetical protein